MFFKGLWGYLPANILQGIVGFATLMVFTRLLTPEEYGQYALAFGVTTLAQTLFFTWIEAAMARFYVAESRDDPAAPHLYGTLWRLYAWVFAGFAVICAAGLWLWPGNGALKVAIGFGLATTVFRSLIKAVQEQRRAEGRVGQASMIDMAQTAGGFAIGVICALAGLGGGSPVLGVGLIALLTLPLFAREDLGRAVKGVFDPARARAYARYGIPVSLSLILTLALYTVDRFLIAGFLNEAEAGAYHAGYSLASRILDVLFIWLGAAGGPAMVHALETGGTAALRDNAREQIRTMAFIMFPATGGLIMVAPAFGTLMIGEALRQDALSVTTLISLGALFSGLNTYYLLQAFTLAKTTRLLVAAMAVPAVSNIALNLALIPTMGLTGAALASTLSFGLGILASWLLGRKALTLPVPWLDLFTMAACTIFMMAVVSLVPTTGQPIDLITQAACGGLVYAGLAWLLDLNDTRALTERIYQRLIKRVAA
jgi:O-antigen/teichoic acid export membrane protein